MEPKCQLGTVQAGGGSGMVWDVCNLRDMGPLIRIDMTLTSDSVDKQMSYMISTEKIVWFDVHRALEATSNTTRS
ncbi:hypothetical protein TNCV_3577541 [Trichonephila clavipes]|uniref:Uncharacterized protein n=1 Tax=Trichonephila clavipes TaxID=2585209 RepID=A0A8X6RG40_TRICX|nr:hypothetical protein TNCV_3577541 [Trichonephila clavipes]